MKKDKKSRIGLYVLIAIIALIVIAIVKPSWFFFSLIAVIVIAVVIALAKIKGTGTPYDDI